MRNGRRGFTLVEILIVVVILGIIAAIVTPLFGTAADEARRGTFVSDARAISQAAEYYMMRTGRVVPDSSTGTFPTELTGYFDQAKWEGGTPIGGEWDLEQDGFTGMSAGFGVHFNGVTPQPDDYMTLIDEMLDDGSLTTGAFKKIASDRFYYVLIP